MSTEIENSETLGLTIKRGPGSGSSSGFWGNTFVEKDLPDNGASITFLKPWVDREFHLNILFGYNSPTGKQYYRSLTMSLQQTKELIEYLNSCVNQAR